MNRLIEVVRACSDHPSSVGQSYWQHCRFSASMSARLFVAATTALIHAIVPGVCQTTTRRMINDMSNRMHQQHASSEDS